MIETDSPYLTPKEFQGQSNEPSFITSTLNHIVSCRKEEKEEIMSTLYKTTKEFFNINNI